MSALPEPGLESGLDASPRLVVLISGQGRNLQALIDTCASGQLPARIVGVISNRADAAGLMRAQRAGIATQVLSHRDHPDRATFDRVLGDAVEALRPDVVVLAGFMRILGAAFVVRFAGRMLNIHPSLLPRHPGLDTHRRALEAGDAEHGATVHFVTQALDGGPCIIQGRLTVRPQDTPQTLGDRVMNDLELRIYPQAVKWLLEGRLALRDGQAWWCDRPLQQPLQLDALEDDFR